MPSITRPVHDISTSLMIGAVACDASGSAPICAIAEPEPAFAVSPNGSSPLNVAFARPSQNTSASSTAPIIDGALRGVTWRKPPNGAGVVGVHRSTASLVALGSAVNCIAITPSDAKRSSLPVSTSVASCPGPVTPLPSYAPSGPGLIALNAR